MNFQRILLFLVVLLAAGLAGAFYMTGSSRTELPLCSASGNLLSRIRFMVEFT